MINDLLPVCMKCPVCTLKINYIHWSWQVLVPYFGFPYHYFFIKITPIQNFALLSYWLQKQLLLHNVRFDKFYGIFKLPLGFEIFLWKLTHIHVRGGFLKKNTVYTANFSPTCNSNRSPYGQNFNCIFPVKISLAVVFVIKCILWLCVKLTVCFVFQV